jgi:hypothetical protein
VSFKSFAFKIIEYLSLKLSRSLSITNLLFCNSNENNLFQTSDDAPVHKLLCIFVSETVTVSYVGGIDGGASLLKKQLDNKKLADINVSGNIDAFLKFIF